MRFRKLLILAAVAAIPLAAFAADHTDSPAAVGEPSADIADVYAWMEPSADKLNLVMTLANSGATFSDAVTYAFHVNSSAGYGMAQTETLVLCKFYDASNVECWAGDSYATGDPSATAGIQSLDGNMRVFAGLRDDPFFMEFVGFQETVKAVIAAAPSLTFDSDGCPAVDAATSGVLVGQLQSGAAGAAASDSFAGNNVQALVIQIDKTVVNSGGSILSVWGSTHSN